MASTRPSVVRFNKGQLFDSVPMVVGRASLSPINTILFDVLSQRYPDKITVGLINWPGAADLIQVL